MNTQNILKMITPQNKINKILKFDEKLINNTIKKLKKELMKFNIILIYLENMGNIILQIIYGQTGKLIFQHNILLKDVKHLKEVYKKIIGKELLNYSKNKVIQINFKT